MLLAVDIGNTNIVLGVFKHNELKCHWRLCTDKRLTSDEYGIKFLSLLSSSGIGKNEVSGAIVSSVVPQLDGALKDSLLRYLGVSALTAGALNSGMPVLTDNPDEVGADRIVNAVAAYQRYKSSLIVVDFGTAVTFDYISENGEYSGGVIAPGIGISSEALFEKTAKLPRVEAVKPNRVIGTNTVESMRSGIFYGFIGLVDGIIEKIMDEVRTAPTVIATGGLAPLVIGESRYVTETDEFLTLKGLKLIYEGNR